MSKFQQTPAYKILLEFVNHFCKQQRNNPTTLTGLLDAITREGFTRDEGLEALNYLAINNIAKFTLENGRVLFVYGGAV